MISRVQKTLGKANDFPNPGTMLTMPSALDDVLGMIKHIVDPHGTNADTQDADTHHHGYSADTQDADTHHHGYSAETQDADTHHHGYSA